MGKTLTLGQVLETAKILEGCLVPTAGGEAWFTVEVTKHGLLYTPQSTHFSREQDFRHLEKMLVQWNEHHSTRPGDYHGTKNASYFLAIAVRCGLQPQPLVMVEA